MDQRSYPHAVVKPAWGASGHLVQLVSRTQLGEQAALWTAEADGRAVLVQQFVPEIAAGEYALVYFAGEYSNTLLRAPRQDEFRVNSKYGGTMTLAPDVDQAMIDFGTDVATQLPVIPTYARIDVVATASGPVLMELEINEPALGLNLSPGSEIRFADALLGAPRPQ